MNTKKEYYDNKNRNKRMRLWSKKQISISNGAYNLSSLKRKYLFDRDKYAKVKSNKSIEFLQCVRFITIDFTRKMVAPEHARANQEKIKTSLDYIYTRTVEEICGRETITPRREYIKPFGWFCIDCARSKYKSSTSISDLGNNTHLHGILLFHPSIIARFDQVQQDGFFERLAKEMPSVATIDVQTPKNIENVQSYVSKYSRSHATDLQHGDLLEFFYPDINSPLVKRYNKIQLPSEQDADLKEKRNNHLRLICKNLERNKHLSTKREAVKQYLKAMEGCEAVLDGEYRKFIEVASMAVENQLEWRPTGSNQREVDDLLRKFLVNMESQFHIGVGKGEMLRQIAAINRFSQKLTTEQQAILQEAKQAVETQSVWNCEQEVSE